MTGAWGPFVPGIDPAERRARLRALRVAAHLLCGRRAVALTTLLRTAESSDVGLYAAEQEFGRLPSLDQRRVLSAFAAGAL